MRSAWFLLSLVACGGGGGNGDETPDAPPADTVACDPSVRTYDIPDLSAGTVMRVQVDPTVVDPAAIAYPESKHVVFLPSSPSIPLRDELFVILPGTNNLGQGFETIGMIAARAGYRVISLAYESQTHPDGTCSNVVGEQAILTCRENVWAEKAYGADPSPEYPGNFANSISGRLLHLLQYIQAQYPNAGASAYYTGDTIRWDRIALAGFSQGSVIAGYIGKDQALARLVILAGGCDDMTVGGVATLAPWCSAPRATPRARTWAISHANDELDADTLVVQAYGLGEYVDASAHSPSYCSTSHALLSHEPTDQAHLSVAHDGAVPLTNGLPTLLEDYYYAFTAP